MSLEEIIRRMGNPSDEPEPKTTQTKARPQGSKRVEGMSGSTGFEPQEGFNAGKFAVRDNYNPPPKPRFPLPDRVPEVEPWRHTYGQWTGNISKDILVPPRGTPEGCYYDFEKAQKAVDFIQSLYYFEGKWAGHHFRLSFWQERLVRYVFGWMRPDHTRLIRKVYLEIPRKNGKSTFAAAIALYLAYEDDEAAPQVFFAASDKEQAGDTYIKARYMVEADRDLADRSIIYGPAKKILIPETHGEIRALSGKSTKLYGLNLHGLVFDELMVQRTRELWDSLTTAQGARIQPLILAITTAGWNRKSVAFEQREYARQVGEGTLEDPTFVGVLYSVDEEEDWALETTWKKATPALGETIDISYYQEKAREALGQPSAQNTFRTLYLCQWVGQANKIILMTDWEKCDELECPSLEGMACWGGLDLSTTTDLTAFVLNFMLHDGRHAWLAWHFLPDADIRDKSRLDRAQYELWAEQGYLTLIPGPVVRDEYIRAVIREAGEIYDIQDISYDRWGAVQLSRDLDDDGFTMVKMGQGFASMSSPTQEVLRLVKSHQLVTRGNPMLRWQADNVSGTWDPNGTQIKFNKAESGSRIDGLIAGTMALDGTMRRGGDNSGSIYDADDAPVGDDVWF